MYFHSYNPDFSDMALFVADSVEGTFQTVERLELPDGANQKTLTPFIDRDESFLLFVKKCDGFHELYVAYRKHGVWQTPERLPDTVNTNNLGNPCVTPDGQYLFFASGHWSRDAPPSDWVIKWVRAKDVLTGLASI